MALVRTPGPIFIRESTRSIMFRTIRGAAAIALGALLLCPTSRAQELDADIKLGDQFKGEILHTSDIDVLRFSSLQSALVTITIQSTSKVKPIAAVVNAGTGAFLDTVPFEKGLGSKKLVIKKLPLPEIGTYEVRVASGNAKLGKYTVKTKVKYPNTITKVKTFLSMAAGETKTVNLQSDEGWKITGLIKPGKNSAALPSVASFTTPAGAADISGFVVQKGKKLKLKKLFTDELGNYVLGIQNVGQAGEIVVDLEVTPAKINKIKWKEPNEPKDPGSIAGNVLTAEYPALPETEPNDSIADTEFVGLSFPGKLTRITGTTSDNGFPGGNGGGPLASADLDSFRLEIKEPQAIHLTLVHHVTTDFDIGVWDVNAGQWVGFIETVDHPEVGSLTVTPPAGQSMLIDVIVYSYAGTGSYILTMNATPPPAGAASDDGNGDEPPAVLNAPAGKGVGDEPVGTERYMQLDLDFMSNAIILKLRDDDANIHSFAADRGMYVELSSPGGPALVRVPQYDSLPETERRRELVLHKERLRALPEVRYAELNYKRQAMAIPNDANYNKQWHYPQMNLPQVWDITKGSSDIIVAVLDTGTLPHPDLVSRDSGTGIDMINDLATALDGDGIDMDPTDPGDKKKNDGTSSWHGAHVAGTIGAATNNGTGVAGVDWNCKLMHIRVLGKGGGWSFDIAEGIKYAAGVENVSKKVPPKAAKVINMSLGGPGINQTEQAAITQARAAGSVVVVAAGNENTNAPKSPAHLDGVVCVASVGEKKTKSYFSNFGPQVDVAAPGGDWQQGANVLSTVKDEANGTMGYAAFQGTSMACPHVAGVCALMLSLNPNLTPDQIEQLLKDNAEDLGDPGKDDLYGHGYVDALKVVKAVQGGATPVLMLSTTSLDYGKTTNTLSVNVTNTGGGNLTWTVTDDADWLDVTPANGGPQEVLATVDRGVLLPGVYTGKMTFTSNGGNAEVAVKMEVGIGDGEAVLSVSTTSLSFGATTTTLKVKIENIGGQPLTWNATDAEVSGGNWMSIAPATGNLNPAQSQDLTVTVDRTGVPGGAYMGSVTVTANGSVPQKVIAVSMNVPETAAPKLSLGATIAFLGAVETTFPVAISNVGGGTLTYTATDMEVGGGTWLSVTPSNGAAPATLSINVDRTGLAAGNYTGTVNVTSNGGNGVINVSMEVLPKDQVPIDLGTIYVLAVDIVTFETVAQANITQFNGDYNLFNVPVGLYLLVAGPDLDGDNAICGVGEPCGFWPINPDPTLLEVKSGQISVGIDFAVTAEEEIIPAGDGGTGSGFTIPEGGYKLLTGDS